MVRVEVGCGEVVIEDGRQREVADAAQEPEEGQEVRSDPSRAKLDDPVPENRVESSKESNLTE